MEEEGWAGLGLEEARGAGSCRKGGDTAKEIGAARNAGLQASPTRKALTALALVMWKQTSPGDP